MQTQIMKLADIKPAEYNPRKDLAPGDFEYEKLKKSIETFGFVEPLVVNIRNNVLISGHQRYKILCQTGATETEVVTVDLDESKEKALNLAMNKIEGFWDYEKLQSLFEEFDKDELTVTGFTLAEIESMFDNISSYDSTGDGENENDSEDDDDSHEEDSSSAGSEEEDDYLEPGEYPCLVYLSFATKESAEAWLAERGIDKKYSKSQNIIVEMEGTEYGTAKN